MPRPSLTLALTASLALAPISATAQQPAQAGGRITLQSKSLGEPRPIDVALPAGYDSSTTRYPVIYVLDGESLTTLTTAVASSYASVGLMPPAIIVGIRNTRRTRDLTPPPAPGFAVPQGTGDHGGADRLLAFLGDELAPYIDRSYRTVPMRVLVGHSLGGLFALHAIAARPALFTGYAILEPSVWWNDQREWRAAESMLADPRARRARVAYVNARLTSADTTALGGDRPLVRNVSVLGETHQSMPVIGIPRALRALFTDFAPPDWVPGTKPIAILEKYDALSARLGYDVTIPAAAFDKVALMSIHAREFDDAERVIARRERTVGPAPDLRDILSEERKTPASPDLIPLVIPAERPRAASAAAQRFVGEWESVGGAIPHRVTIRASGDTLIVRDWFRLPDGTIDENDHQVIRLTANGTLEWGLPWFQGIAALLVEMATIQPDGTMRATREPRGWVPRGPAPEMRNAETFRRVRPPS